MTQPIRVVVANRPRLMRELVLETIRDQPDIEISRRFRTRMKLSASWMGRSRMYLIVTLDGSRTSGLFSAISCFAAIRK